MSSTMQVPPPLSPSPPPRPPRSFAGPIVLIIIGVVFLLGTMGVLQWHHLGAWFAHYWPVLLIVWGVIKLVEHYQAQQSGQRGSGIGAGGVFLLIMLVLFGLMATQASKFDWESIREHMGDNNDFPLFGHTYNYEDSVEQDFPAGASLHVNNERGAVNITVADDNKIRVSVHKRINAEGQSDADKWNGNTKPQITVSGSVVTLNSNTAGAGDHWVASDLDISVPRKADVTISSRRGDVTVLGRDGNVDINNQKGDLSVSDIKGGVTLNLNDSSARISQISSDVSVQGRVNDFSVEDVKGAVHLSGDFVENLRLSRIGNAVSFRSSRTSLDLNKVDGELELDAGDLRGSSITGPVRLTTRSKDIRLEGLSGDVRLEDENGAVELHLSKLGNVQVSNRQGDIQIYLPEKAAFQLDARARNGEIQSDFSELAVHNGDDLATATGSVGGGGSRLVLNNEHGSIEIRRGTSAVLAPAAPPSPPGAKAPRALHSDEDSVEPSDN